MINLSVRYLGMQLQSPVVVSASPLSKKIESIQQMEEAGAGAVVLYSLFEEQLTRDVLNLDSYLQRDTLTYAEARAYYPRITYDNRDPELYLEHVRRARQAVSIPIIASINGIASGDWIEYARQIEQAGADALELNLYYLPADARLSATELEETYVRLVSDVRARIQIPLAVKLTPFFTSLPNITRRFVDAGANGLVLFNRFYQPDIDIEKMEPASNLVLSTSADMRLPMRWIAILYGTVAADFALSSGVHTGQDVFKAVVAGANVAMVTSQLLSNGIVQLRTILTELEDWMEKRGYSAIAPMQGSMSDMIIRSPAAYERSNYIMTLTTGLSE